MGLVDHHFSAAAVVVKAVEFLPFLRLWAVLPVEFQAVLRLVVVAQQERVVRLRRLVSLELQEILESAVMAVEVVGAR